MRRYPAPNPDPDLLPESSPSPSRKPSMTEDEARQRVIVSMCPGRVCRTCGEPSRRQLVERDTFEEHYALARHIKERRLACGFSLAEVNGWFGYTPQTHNWETSGKGISIPNPDDWPTLKARLGLSDDFDDLVMGERQWTESLVEYRPVSDYPSGWTQAPDGRVYQKLQARKDRIAPDTFTDCGHDDWRPGMWIDPFERET